MNTRGCSKWIYPILLVVGFFDVIQPSTVRILDNPTHHKFEWVYNPPDQLPFLEHLNASRGRNEFYYLITGDTQFWFPCTRDNLECLKETQCEWMQPGCNRPQNDFANDIQTTSLRALIKKMRFSGFAPKKLIINGDLTDFGHTDEFDRFRSLWPRMLEGVSVYPGLGNHDYDNNVDQCTLNRCVNRMLNFFSDYVGTQLRRPLDLKKDNKYFFGDSYKGSLAYSWDECVYVRDQFSNPGTLIEPKPKCIHSVQLNNYPSYERTFDTLFSNEWNITNSFDWLRNDLAGNRNKSVIVNFHDFDSKFNSSNKRELRSILKGSNVIGIFFAHIHSRYGLHPQRYWCINGRPVPLIYSGSVPANRYTLIRLDPEDKTKIKALYLLKANNRNSTKVKTQEIPYNRC